MLCSFACTKSVQHDQGAVRAAIEKQYATQAKAYYDQNPDLIRQVRAPDFSAQPPNAPRWTPQDAEAYLNASFQQVKQTLHVSFDIESLTVRGDTAIVSIHQQWKRMQDKGGALRKVETEARQREWWLNTDNGWLIFFVDDVHPGTWIIDGKRVDPSKPYDPDAPPYEPR
jgi:ketosteroid isomerase-like protein